jgi:hypothetical protein
MGKGKQQASSTAAKGTTNSNSKGGGAASSSSTVAQLQGVLSGKKSSRGSLGGKGTGAYGASLSKSKQR